MLRASLSVAVILSLTAMTANAQQDTGKAGQGQQPAGKGMHATITKVDAKNLTVTVRMKDKDGKEAEKTFKLTDDIRYFDSTGKAVAIDVFREGDLVLVVEAEGRLRELHAHGDRHFLLMAAETDLTEMKLGQLAMERGSPVIKKYGERISSDHAKMNQSLLQLAKTHGMTLPDKLDKKHQELFDELSKLKGAEFDRAFAKDMISGHEKVIMKFEAAAKNSRDPQLKAWAEQWLPVLRDHLKLAREAASEIKSKP